MNMTHLSIQASDKSGAFNAYAATPSQGKGPGILVIQEIFGINGFIRRICDGFAGMGYFAVAPDLFWRIRPGIELDAEDPGQFQQALELMGQFNIAQAVEDMIATVRVMRGHENCTGKVGTVGYCLGGRLAYLMATRSDADANVGYYGVGIESLLDEASAITKPLILHIAEEDKFVPEQTRETIVKALSANPMVHTYTYAGADHAFARVGGSHYKDDAATLANQRTMDLFAESLR
jgi:carboxymethylenebutenolidase